MKHLNLSVKNLNAVVAQSWIESHASLLKIALHHRYFSKNFNITVEQQYWKMHQDGCFWGQLYFGNIPEWLLLKDSCKDIFTLRRAYRWIFCFKGGYLIPVYSCKMWMKFFNLRSWKILEKKLFTRFLIKISSSEIHFTNKRSNL